jgi:hypothetical protein
MALVLITTTTVSLAALGPDRTFCCTSTDTNTEVALFSAATLSAAVAAGVSLLENPAPSARPLLVKAGQAVNVRNGSTFVGYQLVKGGAPSAVWCDAAAASPGQAASTSAAGSSALSVAPAVAASPIAVGTNDPRVNTEEIAIDFVAADGTFVESTVWIPGVIGTITGATLSVNASVTQNDTNYLTYTLGIRDGAGGGASSVASQTTKTTGGGAFLGFQALTLGAITNATTATGSQVTFKAAKTGTGQAATGQGLLRVTYTVP